MRNIIVGTVIGGLIATVVGGLLLRIIPKSGDLLTKVASLAWGVVTWILDTLASPHPVPGWAILVMVVLALFGFIVALIVGILLKSPPQSDLEHSHPNYREDMLDGVKWRWTWKGNDFADLWCFCPSCDAQLVRSGSFSETLFICERCPSDGSIHLTGPRGRVVTRIESGDGNYAVDAAKREILRRIRTRES